MYKRFSIVIFIFLLAIAVSLIGYYLFKTKKVNKLSEENTDARTGCSIEIDSSSKILSLEIKDEALLKEFIFKYVPCNDGFFAVGNPISKKASKVNTIKYILTDSEQAYKVTSGRTRENPYDEGELKYSYSFFISDNLKEAYVNLNPTEIYLKEEQFDRILVFTLASLADYLNKYDRPQDLLLRNGSLEDFNIKAEEIGISYEKLI